MTDRLASVPVPIIPCQSPPPPERQTNNLDGAIWLYHSISVWSDIHTADQRVILERADLAQWAFSPE